MKVQNTVSLEQAQSLNKAIKEAGLEWPAIEWDNGFRNHYWTGNIEEWSERLHSWNKIENDPNLYEGALVIPAPNLAELGAMIPIKGKYGAPIEIPLRSASQPDKWWHRTTGQFSDSEIEARVNLLTRLIPLDKEEVFKAHWETL